MKRFYTYLLATLVLAAALSSCKVHEWPEPYKPVQINLHLVFDTALPLYKVIPSTGRASTSIDDYDVRYQIAAWLVDENGNYNHEHEPAYRFAFTRDDVLTLDYTMPLQIDHPGQYHLIGWVDYVDQSTDYDKFYITQNFLTIELQGEADTPHVGNNDFRDAFWGEVDVTIPKLEVSEDVQINLTLPMERPLAKFNFITTDLDQFVTRVLEMRTEAARAEAERKAEAEGRAITEEELAEVEPETRVDLDDFRIQFIYTSHMPYVFNAHDNKPINAKNPNTVTFDAKMKSLGNNQAELGFDYVFVNGVESFVDVRLVVYDKDGTFITSTGKAGERVYITRSKLTTMIGEFLTATADGGVGIDPGFDGDDHNWIVKDEQ